MGRTGWLEKGAIEHTYILLYSIIPGSIPSHTHTLMSSFVPTHTCIQKNREPSHPPGNRTFHLFTCPVLPLISIPVQSVGMHTYVRTYLYVYVYGMYVYTSYSYIHGHVRVSTHFHKFLLFLWRRKWYWCAWFELQCVMQCILVCMCEGSLYGIGCRLLCILVYVWGFAVWYRLPICCVSWCMRGFIVWYRPPSALTGVRMCEGSLYGIDHHLLSLVYVWGFAL